MNKIFFITLIAGGLLLLISPEAAAKHAVRPDYMPRTYQHTDTYYRDSYRRDYNGHRHARSHRMPRWLQHERSFRRWYRHSHHRRNAYVSWYRLFSIYRWETSRYRHHGH